MLRFEGRGNVNTCTPPKTPAKTRIKTGFFEGHIVTLDPLALPLLPHTLPALAAVALCLTAPRAIKLLPFGEKGLVAGGTVISDWGLTA